MSNDAFPLLSSLGGTITNLRRFTHAETKAWSAFNPSIGYSGSLGYAMTFRSSNYIIKPESGELHVLDGQMVTNEVWFTETNESLEILNLRKIDFTESGIAVKRGVEDAKLFYRDDQWMFTGVVLEEHTRIARVGLFTLDPVASTAKFIKLYRGQHAKKPEKNWMCPYEENENFDYIYGANAIIYGEKLRFTLSDNMHTAPLRGNTNLHVLDDGTYIAVMHILRTKKTQTWDQRIFGIRDGLYKDYTHVFVRFDRWGELIECSKEFQFFGSGIEFAAGIVEMGDDFVISFGKDDVSSHAARISKIKVMQLLKDVIL